MKWLKRKEVADKLGVSYNYFRSVLEADKEFPQSVRLSEKVIMYEEGAIEAWMKSKTAAVNNMTMEVI